MDSGYLDLFSIATETEESVEIMPCLAYGTQRHSQFSDIHWALQAFQLILADVSANTQFLDTFILAFKPGQFFHAICHCGAVTTVTKHVHTWTN